jgi:hypothetical protein
MLLTEGTTGETTNAEKISTTRWRMVVGRLIPGLWCILGDWRALVRQSTNDEATNTEVADGREPNGDSCDNVDQDHLEEDFSSKKAFCQDLEKRGLLHQLSSGEPERLGFTLEWYRHSY